jgi:HK97 family phage prohead protease
MAQDKGTAMEREIRGGIAAEIRAEGDEIRVAGYAAVFNQETDIGGYFREVIAPGAFDDAIGRDDVVFLINHHGLPLARTRSGTLKLTQDSKGLRMETVLDATDPDVQSIVPKMKRGDLDKMSFAFWPEVQEWDESGDIPVRTIRKASLHDVSIVTTPAYDGTSIALRSLDQHRLDTKRKNFSAANLRHKLKMNLRLRGAENG